MAARPSRHRGPVPRWSPPPRVRTRRRRASPEPARHSTASTSAASCRTPKLHQSYWPLTLRRVHRSVAPSPSAHDPERNPHRVASDGAWANTPVRAICQIPATPRTRSGTVSVATRCSSTSRTWGLGTKPRRGGTTTLTGSGPSGPSTRPSSRWRRSRPSTFRPHPPVGSPDRPRAATTYRRHDALRPARRRMQGQVVPGSTAGL